MTRPRISVCVTTCNQRTYIRQCLESVLLQAQDADLQILIGDDCSDDGTSEVVAEVAAAHPELITHIRHAARLGASANTKALLARCNSEFIARLDGDDYWLQGKLKRQAAYLEANPGCAAVYTNALTIDEAGNAIGLFNDVGDARIDLAEMLRRGNFLNNSSVLFRAQSVGPWLAFDGPLVDYGAHMLHARKGYLAQLGEPLTTYRVNAQGSMVSGTNDRVRGLYWKAILSVPRDLVTDDEFAYGIADFLRRVVFRALRTRRWGLVREWAPRVFEVSPYGAARTGVLVLASAARAAWIESIGRLRKGPDGRRVNVLYRR